MDPIIHSLSAFVLLFLNIIFHILSSIADVLWNLFLPSLSTLVQLVSHNEPQKIASSPTPHEATQSSNEDILHFRHLSTKPADVSLCFPPSSTTHFAANQSSSSSNSFNTNYTYDRTSSKLKRAKSTSKTKTRRTSIHSDSSTTTSGTRSSSPASSVSSATTESSLKSCLKYPRNESPNIKRRSTSPNVRFANLVSKVKSKPAKTTLRFQQHAKLGAEHSSSNISAQDENRSNRAIPTVRPRQTWYADTASGYDISSAPAYPVSYDYARRAAAAAATAHMYTTSHSFDPKVKWSDFDYRYGEHNRTFPVRPASSRISTQQTASIEALRSDRTGFMQRNGCSYPLQYLYPGCQTQHRSAYTAEGQAYYASRDVYAVAQSRIR